MGCCSSLNVSIQNSKLIPNHQSDAIQSLWEVIHHEGRTLMGRISTLTKEAREMLTFHHRRKKAIVLSKI